MVINRSFKRIDILGCSCRGFVLLARIGPAIAVMKVDHQTHAHTFRPDGLGQYIGLVAPAICRVPNYLRVAFDSVRVMFRPQPLAVYIYLHAYAFN